MMYQHAQSASWHSQIYQKFQHVPTCTKFHANASGWYANIIWCRLIGMPNLSRHSSWYTKSIGDESWHANTQFGGQSSRQ